MPMLVLFGGLVLLMLVIGLWKRRREKKSNE